MAKNLPGVKVRLEESVTERTDDSLSMAPDSRKNLMLPASIIASRANRDACYMNHYHYDGSCIPSALQSIKQSPITVLNYAHIMTSEVVICLTCDSSHVGKLLGAKGENLKLLQTSTGANVSIDTRQLPCQITIAGATEAIVADARRAAEALQYDHDTISGGSRPMSVSLKLVC
jgi:hypothetical protein